jgi:hypothetical protein
MNFPQILKIPRPQQTHPKKNCLPNYAAFGHFTHIGNLVFMLTTAIPKLNKASFIAL